MEQFMLSQQYTPEMAQELMVLLNQYPGFDNCTIQTFDDNKERLDKSLTHIFPGSRTNELLEQLYELNKKGAGIFFSVNNMIEYKRNKESATKIVTWCCDIDNMSKQDQWKLVDQSPLKPSMIVESKNSLHLYWFAIDGNKDNRATIGTGIMDFFKGDPKVCKDYSTLLRLSGFLHMKDTTDPFLVKTVYVDKHIQYTEQQMMEAFLSKYQQQIEIKPYQGIYHPEEYGILGYLSTWNNEEMLKEISSRSMINGDIITFKKNTNGTKQIIVNKKSTGCWIDINGMIGSHNKGGPTRIQWVLWYKNITKGQLIKYVQDNYSHKLLPEHIKQINTSNYLTPKGKLIPVNFAEYLKSSECFEGIDSNIFKYFNNEGLWRVLNDNEVGQIIIREAKDFLALDISKADIEATLKFIKIHSESRVIKHHIQQVNTNEICLYDTILDTNTWSVRPYTKDDYKFSKLPYSSKDIANYDEIKPIRWLKFLEEIFASYENINEIIDWWQEVIGHYLLPITKWGKVYILKGGGRNGKGKFIGAIRDMLGSNNCTTINLSKLEDVDLERLLGKLLAIDSDTSDNIRLDVGTLRKIVDGEIIEGRKRYDHPFEFQPFSRVILASNIDPVIKHMDTNMSRRIVYVPFRENFEHKGDPELGLKLKNEARGIFIWALLGLKRLLVRGKFIIPNEIQIETQTYLSKFQSSSEEDQVANFVQEIGLQPGNELLCKHIIYSMYEIFCKEHGKRGILGKQQLTRVMWNKGFYDKNDATCKGLGIKSSILNMTFLDKAIAEKSYEDSG